MPVKQELSKNTVKKIMVRFENASEANQSINQQVNDLFIDDSSSYKGKALWDIRPAIVESHPAYLVLS